MIDIKVSYLNSNPLFRKKLESPIGNILTLSFSIMVLTNAKTKSYIPTLNINILKYRHIPFEIRRVNIHRPCSAGYPTQ